ncbi:MAG: bacillithiol biosynthesis BshC [Candidatus Latescibacterota bacterium]|nr:MAG: bacillithiol biosynthesis BshC [Candidatus Latescibacterota bacterium]
MVRILGKTELETYAEHSRLFLDYVASPSKGISPWLTGLSSEDGFWKSKETAVDEAAARSVQTTWEDVVDDVHALSLKLGTCDELLGKIQKAESRDTLFVVTGQQPGVLGGPLLAIYKISTAISLAAHVERVLNRPCVPLYWCGADDSDFQEIRSLHFLTQQGSPVTTSMPQAAHAAGVPTGNITLEWPKRVWTGLAKIIDEFGPGEAVKRVVDESFERADDHGELAAAILVGLFRGRVAVVDGRSAAVRRHAKPVFTEYTTAESEIKDEITSQGCRLEDSGYHAQLEVGDDSGVFLLENGVRKNVTARHHARVIDAAERNVEICSPGVVARNLVQDFVFSPVAVVLGPAEIAYRAQMSDLYGRFEIVRPAAVPRLTATFVPPALGAMVETGGESQLRFLLTDPSGYARSIYAASVPNQLDDASRDLEKRVGEAIDRFSDAVEKETNSKTLGKLRTRLTDLRNRTSQTIEAVRDIGKAAALARWPFLSELENVIRPNGKPQERSLSGLTPFLYGNDDAADDLLSIAGSYVDDLLDGRVNHVVYSPE